MDIWIPYKWYNYCAGQEEVVAEPVASNPEPVDMTVPSIPALSQANQEIDATEDSKQPTASDNVVSN